ncbi:MULTISPECIES: hypothetical protein [unclassified Streptomyces]|uniref:hypothetical protein n=1 Tax=unclassified Streptomyces TaxID=2593676 RepID=UPI0033D869C6
MTKQADGAGPLSDQEFEQFRDLLRRYLAHELDQWELLRSDTPYGTAYLHMTRALPPGTTEEMYRPI